MKVDLCISEEIATKLWLNGDNLVEHENFLEFIPKISKDPRMETLKKYRTQRRGAVKKGQNYAEWKDCGFSYLNKFFQFDRNYLNSVTDGYRVRIRNRVEKFKLK